MTPSYVLCNLNVVSTVSLLLFSLFTSTDKMDVVFIGRKSVKMFPIPFYTTYQTYPKIKIIYSGNDYRSWIDVIVSYKEIFENKSLLENKYHYQYISGSYETISIIPYAKDQMLVFNFGKRVNKILFRLKSHKEYKMDNTIFNLSLSCYFRFPVIQDSVDRQVAIQGGIFKFDIYPDYKVIYPD